MYYIGQRNNPQLTQPYYYAYGQLSRVQARAKGNTLYGSITVMPFPTLSAYNAAISALKAKGFRVIDSHTVVSGRNTSDAQS